MHAHGTGDGGGFTDSDKNQKNKNNISMKDFDFDVWVLYNFLDHRIRQWGGNYLEDFWDIRRRDREIESRVLSKNLVFCVRDRET